MGEGRRVLGKTSHDLFDFNSANKMVESDQYVMHQNRVQIASFDSKNKITGESLPMFTAKTVVRAPSGQALGVVGISLVGCADTDVFSEACRLLPQFVKRKHSHLLQNLLEIKTITEFVTVHGLQ